MKQKKTERSNCFEYYQHVRMLDASLSFRVSIRGIVSHGRAIVHVERCLNLFARDVRLTTIDPRDHVIAAIAITSAATALTSAHDVIR